MTRTLTIRPPRIAGEAAAGYLMRAFAINGRRWSRERLAADGHSIAALVHGDAREALATYLRPGEPFPAADTAVAAADGRITICGEFLHREDWTSRTRRWCPQCWADDLAAAAQGRCRHWNVHRRPWWDVSAVTGCPVHGVRLESACPGCGEDVQWQHGSLTRCRCGRHLLACAAVELDPADGQGDAYIVGRLGGAPRLAGAVLDDMALDEAIATMERLGVAAVDEAAGIAALRAGVGRRRLLAEGFRVAVGLPSTADALVERVHASAHGRSRKWGMANAYGGFHEWVRDLPKGPLAQALLDALSRHARGRVTFKSGYAVGGGPRATRTTLQDAAAACGISHERFRRLATALGHMSADRGQGRPVDLTPEIVADIAERVRGTVDLAFTAERLGLSAKATKEFVRLGLIEPTVGRTGPSGPGTWLFRSDAADELLGRVRAVAGRGPAYGRVLPLPNVGRITGTPVAELVRMALQGRVEVFALDDGVGLRGFGVGSKGSRRAVRAAKGAGLSLAAFAEATGIPASAVFDYAARGVLATVGDGLGRVVTKEGRARFERTYVGTPELAATMGVRGPAAVIAALERHGVRPACPRPPFVRVLFHRASAEAAAREWLAARPAPRAARDDEAGLTADEVADRLGINPALTSHLMATGVIASRRVGRARLVHPDEADRFDREHVSGTELAAMLGKRAATAAHPILRDAGVSPSHSFADGGYRLFPRARAVAAVEARLTAVRERHEREAVPHMNGGQAWRRLGMTDVMLAQVNRAGLLRSERRGAAVVFASADIERFAQEYVLGNELDRLLGTSGGAATKMLKRGGVKPVCDRPAFYSTLFRRAEATAALPRGPDVRETFAPAPDGRHIRPEPARVGSIPAGPGRDGAGARVAGAS